MGSVTYTVTGATGVGLDQTGRAYAVDGGSGVTVTPPAGRIGSLIQIHQGTAAFTVGQIVTGAVSGHTATITEVKEFGGTYGGGNWEGQLILSSPTGLFQDGEAVSDPLGGAAVVEKKRPRVDGTMKNPALGDGQPFHEHLSAWSDTKLVSGPQSLNAGDILVTGISAPDNTIDLAAPAGPFTRDGHIAQYASLHVVSAAPTSAQILGPAVTWSGDATPAVYDFNVDTTYSGRTTYSASNISWPTYSSIIDSAGQYWPTRSWLNTQADYEQLGPRGFGGVAGASNEVNFGEDMSLRAGELMLMTTLDPADPDCPYTEIEIKEAMRRIVRAGVDWGIPRAYSSAVTTGPAGGIQQFDQGPSILALEWLGLSASVGDFMTNGGGNWQAAFQITQSHLADFAPHSDQFLPWFSRQRTLPAQSGTSTQITIEFDVDGYANGFDLRRDGAIGSGAIIVRVSDGAELTTSETITVPNSTGAPTRTVNLTGTNTFLSGDVVWMLPAADMPSQAGTYEWSLRAYSGNEKYAYSPGGGGYRSIQAWGSSLLSLLAHGAAGHASLEPVIGYFEGVEVVADWPNAANNYEWRTETLCRAYIAENWQSAWSVHAVPDAFVAGDWTLDASGNVSISTLPISNGRFISSIKYSLDGGALQTVGGLSNLTTVNGRTIDFQIAGYAGEVVRIYAVNALGDSAASDTKSA